MVWTANKRFYFSLDSKQTLLFQNFYFILWTSEIIFWGFPSYEFLELMTRFQELWVTRTTKVYWIFINVFCCLKAAFVHFFHSESFVCLLFWMERPKSPNLNFSAVRCRTTSYVWSFKCLCYRSPIVCVNLGGGFLILETKKK